MSDVVPSGGQSRTPEDQGRYDFYGGLTLAVLAAILIASSFLLRDRLGIHIERSGFGGRRDSFR